MIYKNLESMGNPYEDYTDLVGFLIGDRLFLTTIDIIFWINTGEYIEGSEERILSDTHIWTVGNITFKHGYGRKSYTFNVCCEITIWYNKHER